MSPSIVRARLGVLQCDEVRPELKGVFGDYDQMIINAMKMVSGFSTGVRWMDYHGFTPQRQ